MGLISGLLTLPLTPVRGTVWLAEQIRNQAEAELFDEDALRDELFELEDRRAAGEIDDEDFHAAEDAVLERLVAARSFGEGGDGPGR